MHEGEKAQLKKSKLQNQTQINSSNRDLAALFMGKEPLVSIHWIRCSVSSMAGLDVMAKKQIPAPARNWTSPSLVTLSTEVPQFILQNSALWTDLSHDGINTWNIQMLIHPTFHHMFPDVYDISAEEHNKFSLNLEASFFLCCEVLQWLRN
jgi:hypothetical protein